MCLRTASTGRGDFCPADLALRSELSGNLLHVFALHGRRLVYAVGIFLANL